MTGGVRSLFTSNMFLGGSMALGCLCIAREFPVHMIAQRNWGEWITHGAAGVPDESSVADLHTRPDEICLKLHRRHPRGGLEGTRPASNRR